MNLRKLTSMMLFALVVSVTCLQQSGNAQCQPPIAPSQPWPHDGTNLVKSDYVPAWSGFGRVLLDANFDNKPLNQPIGEGGAAVGEPLYVETPTITTAVRSYPFDSPSLEIQDNDTYAAGGAWFGFLNQAEISTGTVILSADVTLMDDDLYYIFVREAGAATRNFADIYLRPGHSSFFYGTGTTFTCKTNTRHPFKIVFHMNERTMDFWFDGKTIFVGKPMFVIDRGVGSIILGTEHDANLVGTMYVDNIHVTWDENCSSRFNVYMDENTSPTTLVASQLPHPFLTSSNLACDAKYYWRVEEVNSSGATSGSTWDFTSERCACGEVILEANFDADAIDASPDLTLPGDPIGDYAWMGEIGGSIRVKSDPLTVDNQHAVFERIAGPGSVDMRFSPILGSVTGIVRISCRITPWQHNQSAFGVFARDHLGRVPFSLSFYTSQSILWNEIPLTSITYNSYEDYLTEVELDFASHTASLSINGTPIPEAQDVAFYDPLASDFNWFHVGTGSTWTQAFSFDDLRVCVESCCQGMRGNVDSDIENRVNVVDVTYLVNYLFKLGPVPPCLEEANVNGDATETINIVDLTYLVSFLFRGGNPPASCGLFASSEVESKESRISLTCEQSQTDSSTVLILSSDADLTGLEIQLKGSGNFEVENETHMGLEVFASEADGTASIGILDTKGDRVIQSGEQILLKIPAGYRVISALASTAMHQATKVEVTSEIGIASIPRVFELGQNYPNPFNPSTQISFTLPSSGEVKLEIFNMLGQSVRTLLNDRLDAGSHLIEWDGRSDQSTTVSSGIYFYRLTAPGGSLTKKMTLIK